jgi:hypothetical protein
VSEAYIQALVHEHPACLPIAEIDAMFSSTMADIDVGRLAKHARGGG